MKMIDKFRNKRASLFFEKRRADFWIIHPDTAETVYAENKGWVFVGDEGNGDMICGLPVIYSTSIAPGEIQVGWLKITDATA